MILERIRQSLLSDRESLCDSAVRCEKGHRTLITEEPWDCYHLESLLALKETYRENTEFGFLLRHYWIPATVLQFRQSSRTTFPDGRVDRLELEIERRMARCRSNECLWREKTRLAGSEIGELPILSEMLCSYDCYEQTYTSAKPTLFVPPTVEQMVEARRHALLCLPFLCPPGPIPVGFSWYCEVGGDYMNYRLDAEEHLRGTPVLVIRREGQYTSWVPENAATPTGATKAVPVVAQRQGLSLVASNRGVILEDRFIDRIAEVDGCSASAVRATNRVVTRLFRSCPESSATRDRNERNACPQPAALCPSQPESEHRKF